MASAALTTLVRDLQRAVTSVEASDRELLERFLTHREEQAFALLLRRHGPMVLGVCRRALRDRHDAEDAFQATFLVLVRKARSLSDPDRLGPWLYGVAFRTARKAQARIDSRRARHEPLTGCESAHSEAIDADLREWLDRELAALPDKYRDPMILSYLEGNSKRQVAGRLGCPEGTVSVRLDRARRLLRERLIRRGVTLSAAAIAAVLTPSALQAQVPSTLLSATMASGSAALLAPIAFLPDIPASVKTLAQGVLQNMFISKVKTLGAGILAICAVGLLATVFVHDALANRPAVASQSPKYAPVTQDFDSVPEQDFAWELPAFIGAEKDKKPSGPSVQGVLKSIDVAKKSIVVQVPKVSEDKKSVEEKTFELAADARVVLHDILSKEEKPPEGKLTDLSPGTRVNLQLDVDGKKVVTIGAQGPGVHGSIKSAANDSITVLLKDKSGAQEHTFTLVKDAKITLDNPLAKKTDPKPATAGKITDLTEKTAVMIQLTVDRKRALSIRVLGRSMTGRLTAYDAGNSTISISVKEDGQLVDKTFTLAKEARLGDLNVGEVVNIQFSTTDKEKVVVAQGKKSE